MKDTISSNHSSMNRERRMQDMPIQHILFIGAGTELYKNAYKAYQTQTLYLNYGLLGLATNLSK